MDAIKTQRTKFRVKDRHFILPMIFPAVGLIVALRIVPIFYSVWLSMSGWNLNIRNSQNTFVGFKNYQQFLTSAEYLQSLSATLRIGLWGIGLSMLVGISLALLMYMGLKGSAVMRTFLLCAMILAPIVVGTAWRLMYQPGSGLVNYFVELAGFESIPFLSQRSTVFGAIIAVDVWQQSPFVMIVVLAGLQSVPLEIFDSVKIDGANAWQTLFKVTFPMISQSIMLALLIRTMDSLRLFDMVYALTKGGPANMTRNINVLMYQTGFQFYQLGKAAAMSIMILLFVMVPCIIITVLLKRRDSF